MKSDIIAFAFRDLARREHFEQEVSPVSNPRDPDTLLERMRGKLGSMLVEAKVELGHAVVRINRQGMSEFFQLLKIDSDLAFDMVVSLTAVDWMDTAEDRFEMVYHLMSTKSLARLRVKISVPEHNPEVETISSLWKGADFMEREVWDMYGISFKGHPDLRRILMYEEFKGHPLRKDYPLQAKQPRIPMRTPEVENTARKMVREPLIRINPKVPQGVTGAGSEKR